MVTVSPETLAIALCVAALIGAWSGREYGYRVGLAAKIWGGTPAQRVWLAALKVSRALDDAPRVDGHVMVTAEQAREWSQALTGAMQKQGEGKHV